MWLVLLGACQPGLAEPVTDASACIADAPAVALASVGWRGWEDEPPGVGWRGWESVSVIAHRGFACCYPENTAEAIEAAIAAGARAVEVDIRFTLDEVPILMHDETIDRTTDHRGEVASLTFGEIRRADACPALGEPCMVPSLAEALAQMAGRTKIVLDLKDAWTCGRIVSIDAAIEEAGVGQSVALVSAIPITLELARSRMPLMPLAFVGSSERAAELEPVGFVERLGSAELLLNVGEVRGRSTAFYEASRKNVPVVAWTAVRPEHVDELLAVPGVRRVLTDVPPRP